MLTRSGLACIGDKAQSECILTGVVEGDGVGGCLGDESCDSNNVHDRCVHDEKIIVDFEDVDRRLETGSLVKKRR